MATNNVQIDQRANQLTPIENSFKDPIKSEKTDNEIKDIKSGKTPLPESLQNNKKCILCRKPADSSQTICFLADAGYGWIAQRFYFCSAHSEHLADGEVDDIYVKHRISKLATLRKNDNKVKNKPNPPN
jgi:hypothetical protein